MYYNPREMAKTVSLNRATKKEGTFIKKNLRIHNTSRDEFCKFHQKS